MPAVIRQGRVIATCDICGRMAHLSYGADGKAWACFEHKREVEQAASAKESGK